MKQLARSITYVFCTKTLFCDAHNLIHIIVQRTQFIDNCTSILFGNNDSAFNIFHIVIRLNILKEEMFAIKYMLSNNGKENRIKIVASWSYSVVKVQ